MLITPEYVFQDVTHITPEWLAAKGIRALVLDIDNTLTADRSQELPEEVAQWLAEMRSAGIGLTIVSNGAEKRVRPFAEKLGLAYLYRSAKPLPFALMVARRRMGVRRRPNGHPAGAGPRRTGHPEAQVGKAPLAGILRPGRKDPVSEWKIRFGTAGTSDSFAAQGGKTSLDIPEYTAKMGLNAFEYQCGHGVRLGLDKAAKMAALAAPKDILFSVHAPYYISMSSLEEDKRLNSVNYLLQSAAVCRALGGQRVIFHSGSCGKQSREAALEKALDTLRRAQTALDEAGFSDITLCPETMGKIGQLGTLDEVLELCKVDERITPCIDFGHLNARTLGGIASKADYAAILDKVEAALGGARAKRFHVHFSRIEYSAGGEKRHWTFAETQFGPEPQPLMELLAERGLEPVIICESAGTQAEDACTMQRLYGEVASRKR